MDEKDVGQVRRIAKDVTYEVLEEGLLKSDDLWEFWNAVDAGIAAARQHMKKRKVAVIGRKKQK